MTATTYLGITKLTERQASAEVTLGTALDTIDEQFDSSVASYVRDDFLGTPGSTSAPFKSISSGTGASVAATAGDANHPGVLSCSTGTTTTGYTEVASDSQAAIALGSGETRVRCVFRIPTLSDGTETFTVRAGLGDSAVAGEPTDGVFLRYTHGTNSGKFEVVTRSNGTETAGDSGVTAVAGTWYRFDATVNNDASEVSFYLKSGTDASALVATSSTNIPTGTARALGVQASILKSAGTTARTLELDLCEARLAVDR